MLLLIQNIKKKKTVKVTLDLLFYLSGLQSPHLNNEVIGLEQGFPWKGNVVYVGCISGFCGLVQEILALS